MRYLWYW